MAIKRLEQNPYSWAGPTKISTSSSVTALHWRGARPAHRRNSSLVDAPPETDGLVSEATRFSSVAIAGRKRIISSRTDGSGRLSITTPLHHIWNSCRGYKEISDPIELPTETTQAAAQQSARSRRLVRPKDLLYSWTEAGSAKPGHIQGINSVDVRREPLNSCRQCPIDVPNPCNRISGLVLCLLCRADVGKGSLPAAPNPVSLTANPLLPVLGCNPLAFFNLKNIYKSF